MSETSASRRGNGDSPPEREDARYSPHFPGTQFRTESDSKGEREVPADALYGIHTVRALENFPLSGRPVHVLLVHAFGAVKLACARANRACGTWKNDVAKADAIEQACREMMEGRFDGQVLVDALQGGAGTSTNMNVNEVLANRALQILGEPLGNYARVSPHDDLNLHQSTNDTFPTALRVAAVWSLRELEEELVALQEAFQAKEQEFAGAVKVGRTEMQDAVLITLGREMGAYAEAFARDRWRVFKCEERLRTVNLGGTAVGTGLGAPRSYIFSVVDHLRDITGIGLGRAENLVEATQNADAFVEVSGTMKACAANLIKVSNDLRLLSSGPEAGLGEIELPERQAGSTIMPGKVNPVIPEAVAQAAMMVFGYDAVISHAASAGNLELNQFMPLIASALLDELDLLHNACRILRMHCVTGIRANAERCRKFVESTTATVTALVEELGYDKAEALVKESQATGKSLRQLAEEKYGVPAKRFDELVSPEAVNRLGSVSNRSDTSDPSERRP
ncbi:MAG TPA: aspartate ammonia-lyase [bacterium]|nr:aspartate ammonia-lyase [bacterium]